MNGSTQRMKAADWVQRVNSSAVSDEELKEWLEWYGRSEDNRRAFDDADVFFRTVKGAPPVCKDAVRRMMEERFGALNKQHVSSRRSFQWAAAAVLVLAIAGTVVWRVSPRNDGTSTRNYQTARGEHRTVELADGSTAVIGAQSRLEVRFDAENRLLKVLSGEAYFQVKRDPKRPFVVQAGPAHVRALGTAFDVHRGGDRVTVTVTDGAVEVERIAPEAASPTATQRLRVAAGERMVVTEFTKLAVSRVDAVSAVAWRSGQLSFSDEPLSAVIETVNRYTPHRISIDDPRLGEMTFTGTVLPDRVEEWIVNLSQAFPVRAVAAKDGTFVLVTEEKK